ncbi:hypothetical protein WME90_47550 [Sorangium sp. So ce375]|uniref:hypothetical protein n=1 Tax=Sorangium sp. So ce375 TaxID=3133306 RepID=UPI003F5C04F6
MHLMLLDGSFRRTLLAGLLLSAGPWTAAALLIAAPGCDGTAGDDISCFDWPEELGACLDREQALEELNLLNGHCSDWIVVSVESDAKQRDGECCYEVVTRYSHRCPMEGVGGRGVSGVGSGDSSVGSGGQSAGGGGLSEGGGGLSEGGGGLSAGGGGQSDGGGGLSEGGGGQSAGGGGLSEGGGGAATGTSL